MALRLPGLQHHVGLIRRSRHQAMHAGWRCAYPAYNTT
ncbi:Hypothetical protein ABZS17I87_01567 [Kosakonia cowanii]